MTSKLDDGKAMHKMNFAIVGTMVFGAQHAAPLQCPRNV